MRTPLLVPTGHNWDILQSYRNGIGEASARSTETKRAKRSASTGELDHPGCGIAVPNKVIFSAPEREQKGPNTRPNPGPSFATHAKLSVLS